MTISQPVNTLNQTNKILITGASGFIGTALSKKLLAVGWELVIVGRKSEQEFRKGFSLPCQYYRWENPTLSPPPPEALDVQAIINLMGEPLAGKRWTKERKSLFVESRVQSTRQLVNALNAKPNKLETFISVSAIGIYGDRANNELDEQSSFENDFLSILCQDWEKEAKRAPGRNVQLRLGLVLSSHGGALSQMVPLFENGLGGRLSSGKQWMSWIHLDDVVNIFVEILSNPLYSGPVNAVAPRPVSNSKFTVELAKALKVKTLLPVPKVALYLSLGEVASMVLASQKVVPNILLKNNYRFLYSDLTSALNSIYAWKLSRDDRLFEDEQWVSNSKLEVFSFFCNEQNLETITPPFLHFKVLNKSTSAIAQGTEIEYDLRIHGIPVKWLSRISIWKPNSEFQDIQIKGPYSKWQHTHLFEDLAGGTLITDKVIYSLPLATFGGNLAQPLIAADIKKIFDYRKTMIAKFFANKNVN
jgi:uncharacterized protein (TIGR01777 family)